MIHGMQYTETWGAIACHSGDAYFEFCYLPDFPRLLNELARYRRPPLRPGRHRALPRAGRRRPRRRPRATLPRGDVGQGQAHRRRRHMRSWSSRWPPPTTPTRARSSASACRWTSTRASSSPSAGRSGGSTIPSTSWPATRATCASSAASTSIADGATSITCTSARASSRASSRRQGIEHTYEEFDDTHSSIDYRMDVSLPFLYRAVKP